MGMTDNDSESLLKLKEQQIIQLNDALSNLRKRHTSDIIAIKVI